MKRVNCCWQASQSETVCVFVLRSGESMMPTELELNRVINNVQELLYSASDVSHDRCVKVLTARAKVRDQPSAQSSRQSPH